MVSFNKKVGGVIVPFIIELVLDIYSYSNEAYFYHIMRFIIQIIMIILSILSIIIKALDDTKSGILKAVPIILIIVAIALISDLIFEVISLSLFIYFSNFITPLSKLGYGIHFISLSYLLVLISEINEKNNIF